MDEETYVIIKHLESQKVLIVSMHYTISAYSETKHFRESCLKKKYVGIAGLLKMPAAWLSC